MTQYTPLLSAETAMCHCTHLQGKSWQIGKSDMKIKMQNAESAPVKGKKAKDKGYLTIKPLSSHSLLLTSFKTAIAAAAAEYSQWWGGFRQGRTRVPGKSCCSNRHHAATSVQNPCCVAHASLPTPWVVLSCLCSDAITIIWILSKMPVKCLQSISTSATSIKQPFWTNSISVEKL